MTDISIVVFATAAFATACAGPHSLSYNVDVCQNTLGNASLPTHIYIYKHACAHSFAKSQQFSSCARARMVPVKPQARTRTQHGWPCHAISWHSSDSLCCLWSPQTTVMLYALLQIYQLHGAALRNTPILFCFHIWKSHAVIERIHLFCICQTQNNAHSHGASSPLRRLIASLFFLFTVFCFD